MCEKCTHLESENGKLRAQLEAARELAEAIEATGWIVHDPTRVPHIQAALAKWKEAVLNG
jgi:hypothetical protein